MKTILITGGAGYIGRHLAHMLFNVRVPFVILDDLSSADKMMVDSRWEFVEGDIADSDLVAKICKDYDVGYCVHMAAKTLVSESVSSPGLYRKVNVEGTKKLVEGLKAGGVKYLAFSSTCAVFGDPEYLPIDETHPKNPMSPYGQTKKECEEFLLESGLTVAILRYFNVAGGALGEFHSPETHLIPNVAMDIAAVEPTKLYGTDYPTEDGTAVRDYVHVDDIASANVYALAWIEKHGESNDWNIASGLGFSVRDIVGIAADLAGRKNTFVTECERRAGDPPALIGDFRKAEVDLDWEPSKTLENMIKDALALVPPGE